MPLEDPLWVGVLDDVEAVALELGPDEWLDPVHEAAAHLHVGTRERGEPRSASQTIASLQDHDAPAADAELSGCAEPGQATADHSNVEAFACDHSRLPTGLG